MEIRCVWEHNGADTLLHAENFPGVATRGASLAEASAKMERELRSWFGWQGLLPQEAYELEVVQEKETELQIRDADSDVLFEGERQPLTREEYERLKTMVLQSAADFLKLYESVPERDVSCLPVRQTFYGPVPRTAREMYEHTKGVNAYYFAEIDVEADSEGDILTCRRRGLELLEQKPDFLEQPAAEGSYGEWWSLRKVLRRFLWHDRIHAKAMYRMAVKTFGAENVENVFRF